MFGGFGYFNNPFGCCGRPFMMPFMPMYPITPMPMMMPTFNMFGAYNRVCSFMDIINNSLDNDGKGSGVNVSFNNKQFKPANVNVSKVEKRLGTDFITRVKQVAKNINCDYSDLLAVINAESGLNPQAVNKHGGATGLIQFMPATAKALGTTTEKLKNMSAVEQMDYVEKYLLMNKRATGNSNKKLSGGDLYSLIFLPARANRDILCTTGEKYYSWNKGLDINKDGKITKAELSQRVANHSYIA